MARKLKAGAMPPVPTETDPAPAPAAAAPAEEPKRRGRPRKAPPPTNVTDETIREHCEKCATAFGEMQTARDEVSIRTGAYRSRLKEAGKAGVPKEAITWWLAARRREPGDIDRETRDRNRIARIMALPIGTQLGLFDDGGTVAGAVDQEQLAAADGKPAGDAYIDGKLAGGDGKPLSTNPYPAESQAADEWERGWGDGTASNVLGGAAGANGAAAHA